LQHNVDLQLCFTVLPWPGGMHALVLQYTTLVLHVSRLAMPPSRASYQCWCCPFWRLPSRPSLPQAGF